MKKRKNKNLQQNGITLIALVITIIVLLILAGVSIAMLTGENGILNQATRAKDLDSDAKVLEAMRLEVQNYRIGKETNKMSTTLLDYLKTEGLVSNDNIINVQKLIGSKLHLGNGENGKDIYVLEPIENQNGVFNIIYYGNSEDTIREIGEIEDVPEEVLEETDPDLFEITEDGTISLKDRDAYYNGEKKWTIETLVIPKYVDGIEVKKISEEFAPTGYGNYFGESFINTIKKVVIPNTVTDIGYGAFKSCENLESVNLPEGIEAIKSNTFYGCKNLKEIILPSTINTIESYAFKSCTSLKEIILPSTINTIESYAFESCTGIKEIYIPKSVENMEYGVFAEWTENQTIYIPYDMNNIPSGWDENWTATSWDNPECKAQILKY